MPGLEKSFAVYKKYLMWEKRFNEGRNVLPWVKSGCDKEGKFGDGKESFTTRKKVLFHTIWSSLILAEVFNKVSNLSEVLESFGSLIRIFRRGFDATFYRILVQKNM